MDELQHINTANEREDSIVLERSGSDRAGRVYGGKVVEEAWRKNLFSRLCLKFYILYTLLVGVRPRHRSK